MKKKKARIVKPVVLKVAKKRAKIDLIPAVTPKELKTDYSIAQYTDYYNDVPSNIEDGNARTKTAIELLLTKNKGKIEHIINVGEEVYFVIGK